MKVKVFEKNDSGKIEFTRKELEALLNDVYKDGYDDGHKVGYNEGRDSKTYTWSPSWTCGDTITLPNVTNPSNIPYYTTTTTLADTGTACLNNITDSKDTYVYYGESDIYADQISLNL